MFHLRSVKGYTRPNCSPSENIGQGIKVTLVSANTYSYRERWGERLLRKDGSRISKIALEDNPNVGDMWGVQERDGHCEVGTGQKR